MEINCSARLEMMCAQHLRRPQVFRYRFADVEPLSEKDLRGQKETVLLLLCVGGKAQESVPTQKEPGIFAQDRKKTLERRTV